MKCVLEWLWILSYRFHISSWNQIKSHFDSTFYIRYPNGKTNTFVVMCIGCIFISHLSVCRPANRTVSVNRVPADTFRCPFLCTDRSWSSPFVRWKWVCGRTSLLAWGSVKPRPPYTQPRTCTAYTPGQSCTLGWLGTPNPVHRDSACMVWSLPASPPLCAVPDPFGGRVVAAATVAEVPRVPRKLRAARKVQSLVTAEHKVRSLTFPAPSLSSPGTCSIALDSRPCKNDRLSIIRVTI